MFKKVCLFSGNANPELAAAIGQYLETPLGKCKVTRFSDGESFVEIGENVRGVDAFVIQPTSSPDERQRDGAAHHDATRSAARRPGRSPPSSRTTGTAGRTARSRRARPSRRSSSRTSSQTSGVNRVVSVDLHAGQIQGFFNIPFDHLYAMPVFLEDYLKKQFDSSAVFVSPDAGGVERTRAYSKRLDASLAIIDKRRERANVSEVMNLIGEVKGKDCIIIDDIIDTAGTLTRRRARARREGRQDGRRLRDPRRPLRARRAAHRRLAPDRGRRQRLDPALARPPRPARRSSSCRIARLLGEAIKRIHSSDSVSSLFA